MGKIQGFWEKVETQINLVGQRRCQKWAFIDSSKWRKCDANEIVKNGLVGHPTKSQKIDIIIMILILLTQSCSKNIVSPKYLLPLNGIAGE